MKFAVACLLGLARASGDWPENDSEMCAILGGDEHYDECMTHMADSCVSKIVWKCSNDNKGEADDAYKCLDDNAEEIHSCPSFDKADALFGKAKKIAKGKKVKKIAKKNKAHKIAKKIAALQTMEAWNPGKDEFCYVMEKIATELGESLTHAECLTGANCAGNWELAQNCIDVGNAAGAAGGDEAGWTAGLTCLSQQQWNESCNAMLGKHNCRTAGKLDKDCVPTKGPRAGGLQFFGNPSREEFCGELAKYTEMPASDCVAGSYCGNNWDLAMNCYNMADSIDAGLQCLGEQTWSECTMFGRHNCRTAGKLDKDCVPSFKMMKRGFFF